MKFCFSILAGFLLHPLSLFAVIISGGDGTGNTSAPADDSGWSNIGRLNGATGIYLGLISNEPWVLTAAHVGIGSITLGGQSYAPVAGSAVRLKNPDNSDTDLVKFRLQSDPGLPALTLAGTSPPTGSELLMIGSGRNREPGLTTWYVNTTSNPWQWSETFSGQNAAAQGYKWSSGSAIRWGTNTLSGTATINAGFGDVVSLYTVFDNRPDEGQAAGGDSGGALFYKNGSLWELAGVMVATGGFNNQPANTSVFGNATYSADVSAYVSQIPEPSTVALSLLGILFSIRYARIRR